MLFQSMPVRLLPIRSVVLICMLLSLGGCASISAAKAGESTPKDPWEPMNRAIFDANMALDGWVVKPVAIGYRKVTPEPVERGVHNFFSNVAEVRNAFNNVLQWKWRKAGNNSGRFLLNSTVGIAGLVDVAKHAGLKKQDEETFGQTLSHWGVGAGPYLVLPFLGSYTLTDAVGLPLDWYADPLTYVDSARTSNTLKLLDLLDDRVSLLDAEKLMTGDRYTFVRDVYLQRREFLVNDGEVEDDFGGDFGEFDDDF